MTTFKPYKTFAKLVLVTNTLLILTLLVIIGEASGILFGCLAFFNLIFALPLSLLLTRIQSWRYGHSFWPQSKKKTKPRIQRQRQIHTQPKKEGVKGFDVLGSSWFSATTIGLDEKGQITTGVPCIEI